MNPFNYANNLVKVQGLEAALRIAENCEGLTKAATSSGTDDEMTDAKKNLYFWKNTAIFIRKIQNVRNQKKNAQTVA